MQQQGWQAILDNFKEYVESREKFSKIHFDIEINCPAKKVYDIMLDKENYEIWTKEFNAESTFEGSWKKGSEIRFIGIGEDGRKGGMLSRIRENIPGRFISMEHFGIIEGDNERTEGEDIEKWSGGREEYTFVEKDGITTLSVDTDTIPEFSGYFDESWPKALQKLKSLCEE
ncbi:MAG: SRPBCC domain-containing protein [Bacteroidales bacterium]|nr:SRPBCC domain-containing protein [Bacteroidales bacterium]